MKTKAAILYQVNTPLAIEEIETPVLGHGQVLVKIAYAGICHTQIDEIKGLKGEDKFLPHSLGHEGSGIVEEIGSDVTKVKVGDHIVATWIKGTGTNVPLAIYKSRTGTRINSGAISTFMEHAVISENRLVKIPAEMPLRCAALLGCALPTGAGMVAGLLREKPVQSIVIFGAGGIGLSAIVAARAKNIPNIIIVDIVDQKLAQAAAVGANVLINAAQVDAVSEILKVTENTGADCAIECAGTRQTMESAFRAVKYDGGSCVLAGNLPHGETISIDPMDLIRGKKLYGSWGGGTDPDHDIPTYAAQYLAGRLKFDQLITHEFTLDDINAACTELAERRLGRAIVRMGGA